jgi:hypothetical protein
MCPEAGFCGASTGAANLDTDGKDDICVTRHW